MYTCMTDMPCWFSLILVLIYMIYFHHYAFGHEESCFELYPHFNAVDNMVNRGQDNRPNTFFFGNTSGNVKQCEHFCSQEWSCVYYTQFMMMDVDGQFKGLCYGRNNFNDTMTAMSSLTHISGMKIPCRYDNYIEVFDASNVGVHTTGSGVILKENTILFTSFGVSSVHVYGPSVWMLHSEVNYGGRSLMLTEGYWQLSTFGHFGDNAMKSAKMIDTCPDRPIGLQNRNIIPDVSFTQWQALEKRADPFKARLNAGQVDIAFDHALLEPNGHYPGGWVHYHNTCCDYGLQVDLGQLYRVYAVGTQGSCNCDGVTLSSAYYTSKYRIAYSADGINYQEVQYNGANKVFDGNVGSTYKQEIKNTFQTPFVASHVRLITKAGYYFGLKMEFYGCAVGTADLTPKLTDFSHQYNEINTEHVTDKDNSTCVDLSALSLPTLKIPVGIKNKSTLDVTLFLSKTCSFDPKAIMVSVNKSPPLQYDQGMFQFCILESQLENSALFEIKYICSCDYGICESVIIKTLKNQSGFCMTLCDINVV